MTFSPQLEERFAKMLDSLSGGRKRSAVVPMLIYAQDEVGAITPELIEEVARRCGVAPCRWTKWSATIRCCTASRWASITCRSAPTSVACWWAARNCTSTRCKKLGIGHKEVTADGQFSLEEVECMGACSWAPAVEINYDFHHYVTPEQLDQLIDGLRKAH